MPPFADKDACLLLDSDHLAVKHLFVAYARLAYAQAAEDQRLALASAICEQLTVHAQVEEELFYPALREAGAQAADAVDEAVQEHAQAKQVIAEIRNSTTADAALDQQVALLARLIEDHVKEERDVLFPKARAAAGLDLAALGQQLQARQQELQAAA